MPAMHRLSVMAGDGLVVATPDDQRGHANLSQADSRWSHSLSVPMTWNSLGPDHGVIDFRVPAQLLKSSVDVLGPRV